MAVLRSQPSRGLAVWKTIFLIPIFLFTALTFWLMQSAAHQQNSTIDDDTATFFAPTVVVGIPRQRVIAKPDPFPPLEEVTELMKQIHNEVNRTAGQFILDFAILGFAKCGTSTMMHWLGQHPEMQVFPEEVTYLQRRQPWDLLELLYNFKSQNSSLLRGYKSPNDIGDTRPVRLLREFFPETKIIIGLRHPVWMMQSFYNFRIQNGFPMVEFKELGFSNTKGHFGVTFSRLAFQNDLINLGKTNMTSHSELNLLTLHKRQAIEKNGRQPKSPHKIFLYDTSQLNDKNEERQAHFLKGLGNFLGLTQELPPAIHFVPGKKPRSSEEQKARDAKKINICDEKHIKRRQKIILKIGRDAQEWILNYFLASPDVMVSNPDHFRKVVESYQFDPCPGNETIVLHNKTSYA